MPVTDAPLWIDGMYDCIGYIYITSDIQIFVSPTILNIFQRGVLPYVELG